MIYVGRHYAFQGNEREYRQNMRQHMALVALMGVAQVAGGMMPVPALYNTWYVIAPYLLTFLSVVSLVWAVCRMAYWGNPLREYVYDTTAKQIPVRATVAMILSMCTLCGQIAYMMMHSMQGGQYFYTFVFLGLQVVVFVCSFLVKRKEIQMLWTV